MNQVITERAVAGSGVAAAGAGAAPTTMYAEYLVTHGIGIMSYADWIKVIGAVYVLVLLLKTFGVFAGIRKLYKWITK